MQTLGFDESAILATAGLAYAQLPVGGPEFPYTPALLEAFAAQVAKNDGKVLLHCAYSLEPLSPAAFLGSAALSSNWISPTSTRPSLSFQ